MGCGCSLPIMPMSRQAERRERLEGKLREALHDIVSMKEPGNSDASFTRIILKFPVLRRAIASLREVFTRFDTDKNGTIDSKELMACLTALGARLSSEDVEDLFTYTNFSHRGSLHFKEFVLCLCLCSLLQLFPGLKAYSSSTNSTADNAGATQNGGGGVGGGGGGLRLMSVDVLDTVLPDVADATLRVKGGRLVKALKIILEAYVLFDKDGNGSIDKAEVLAMIEEEGKSKAGEKGAGRKVHKERENVLLSRERWMELDYDNSGEISFAEFVHAFMDWVGIVDEDDDEDENEVGDTVAVPAENSTANLVKQHGSFSVQNAGAPTLLRKMSEAEVDKALEIYPSRRILENLPEVIRAAEENAPPFQTKRSFPSRRLIAVLEEDNALGGSSNTINNSSHHHLPPAEAHPNDKNGGDSPANANANEAATATT